MKSSINKMISNHNESRSKLNSFKSDFAQKHIKGNLIDSYIDFKAIAKDYNLKSGDLTPEQDIELNNIIKCYIMQNNASFEVIKKMNEKIELYKTDYVLVDKEYRLVEDLDTCYAKESVVECLQENYTEKEIASKMSILEKEGELIYDSKLSLRFVSMASLPREIQAHYVKTFNKY